MTEPAKPSRATRFKFALLDAKKAIGCVTVVTSAALAEGLLPPAWAPEITGGAAVLSTAVVYLLDNFT